MSMVIDGSNGLTFPDTSTMPNAGIGTSAQTWQNVTSSRALNTTYTNSTGRPIMVILTINAYTGDYTMTVNGQAVIISYPKSGSSDGVGSIIIPTGATYLAQNSGSIQTNGWWELR